MARSERIARSVLPLSAPCAAMAQASSGSCSVRPALAGAGPFRVSTSIATSPGPWNTARNLTRDNSSYRESIARAGAGHAMRGRSMSCGSVRARIALITRTSGNGEGRRPGVPGAASALAGWFGRAARGWWRACAASACAVPRRAPRVRGGAQREGRPGRHRASAGARAPASSPPSPPDPSRAARAGARRPRSLHTPDRPRGRLRRAAAAGLLACAAALALPALPGPGGVAHADVLVSNLGQANTSSNKDI